MVLITLSSFLSATIINLYMRADKKNKVPDWLKMVGGYHDSQAAICADVASCQGRQSQFPTFSPKLLAVKK